MAQLGDDCFAFGGELMSAGAALALLKANLAPLPAVERVKLAESAGRILAGPLVATRDVPPADNVAVDGYAVCFADLRARRRFRSADNGTRRGRPPLRETAAQGGAIRVFTGALLPTGTDTVLMQEDCKVANGAVTIPAGYRARRQSQERRRGREGGHHRLGRGPAAAGAGSRARRLARAYRACSLSAAARRPLLDRRRVARAGHAPCRWARSSTPTAIPCRRCCRGSAAPCPISASSPDRAQAVHAALAEAAANHDLVLTSGGMSTGEEDHVRAAVEALGKLHFWRLAIKPGRPVAMGQLGRIPFMGLPGNPVAVMVTFLLLARPLVLLLSGAVDAGPRLYRVQRRLRVQEAPEPHRIYPRAPDKGTPTATGSPKNSRATAPGYSPRWSIATASSKSAKA